MGSKLFQRSLFRRNGKGACSVSFERHCIGGVNFDSFSRKNRERCEVVNEYLELPKSETVEFSTDRRGAREGIVSSILVRLGQEVRVSE